MNKVLFILAISFTLNSAGMELTPQQKHRQIESLIKELRENIRIKSNHLLQVWSSESICNAVIESIQYEQRTLAKLNKVRNDIEK